MEVYGCGAVNYISGRFQKVTELVIGILQMSMSQRVHKNAYCELICIIGDKV